MLNYLPSHVKRRVFRPNLIPFDEAARLRLPRCIIKIFHSVWNRAVTVSFHCQLRIVNDLCSARDVVGRLRPFGQSSVQESSGLISYRLMKPLGYDHLTASSRSFHSVWNRAVTVSFHCQLLVPNVLCSARDVADRMRSFGQASIQET